MSKPPESSSKLALCIGINDYPGTGSDLRGCVNDANDWAAELRGRGFEVQLLLDAQATGSAIRDAIRSTVARVKKGGLVVITNSAHGSFQVDVDGDEEDGMDECWCPFDVVENGPIIDDELNSMFGQRRKSVRLVVISDSCHSGTVSRLARDDESVGAGGGSDPAPAVRFLAPEVFVEQLQHRAHGGLADRRYTASPPGRNSALLLSGCQDAEYSYDAWFQGRPNGAFTHTALRVLKSLPSDATYEEWHRRIRLSLPSQRYPQTPNLYGERGMSSWGVLRTAAEDESADDSGCGGGGKATSAANSAVRGGVEMAQQVIATRVRSRATPRDFEVAPRGRRPVLIAEGDSWFDFPGPDVLDCLEDTHGYDVFSCANKGDTVEEMAYSTKQLDKLLRLIEKVGPDAGRDLRGILLSGGGNDIAGDEFAQLLEHALSPQPGLNEQVVSGVIDVRLRDAYARMLSAITEVSRSAAGGPVPILLHGYDYAVPDGRGFWGGWWVLPGPWLKPALSKKGYKSLEENKKIVAQLIDRFNGMLEGVAASPEFQHVRYVNIRGRLSNGPAYKSWWCDELHPTREGFEVVAREFSLALR